MNLEPLIELSRGGVPECLHFGAIAVVDRHGKLLAQAGDPHWLSFTRSTLKAMQALPFLQSGGAAQFGFDTQQLAMLCASHNGEDMHVAQAQAMLDKAGLGTRSLRCGCHLPGVFAALETCPPPGFVYDERHNNCSGKHAGFLAYCVQHGLALDRYEDPLHPLQVAVRQAVARATGMDENALKIGVDGCSAPNYAMPLANLAWGYARLASGQRDGEFGESFALLADAMTRHPDLVSGTGRNDLAFMRAGRGDWVTKIGADGVQAVASKSRGEAFAIKIIDANKPALHATTVEVLAQLGWLDDAQREQLHPWRARDIVNARGLRVGERKPLFQLQCPA
ncbi:MAG: asparaginase [Betaproteobacteria bacterium]|nr:asparaginase [Betaproteobacteria bacterium]